MAVSQGSSLVPHCPINVEPRLNVPFMSHLDCGRFVENRRNPGFFESSGF
jgi:hypothetical protein